MSSPGAYDKFLKSMVMDFDKWHDGVGYDLDLLPLMTDEERAQLSTHLSSRSDWRDAEALEVLARLGTKGSARAVQAALQSDSAETRLVTLMRLQESASLPMGQIERQLLEELKTCSIGNGMTHALLLCESVNTRSIRARLLWGVIHRRDVAVHYGALLYHLAGKSDDPFDWNMRPLFLKLQEADETVRQPAIDELCNHVEMKRDDAQ